MLIGRRLNDYQNTKGALKLISLGRIYAGPLRYYALRVIAPYLKVIRCKESQTLDVEKAKEKSQLKQLVLTTLFGPLGLFYSNKIIAVFLSIFIIPSILAFGFGLFFGWPFSMLVGVICVKQHNIKAQPFLAFQKRKAQYEQGRINGNV